VNIRFCAIGSQNLVQLLRGVKYEYEVYVDESDLTLQNKYDVAVLDMLETSDELLLQLKLHTKLLVSLSPVYNKFPEIDILFHRTKYFATSKGEPKNIYSGFEYAIIQEHCKKISTSRYENNLQLEYFPVAISMGGGDAANLTLQCLKELKKCKVPATFWVLLGEGYKYSYDELVDEIRRDSLHEILLVKTNQSMWHILQNCLMMIIPGGVTAYEAAYAGIPTIIYEKNPNNNFLLKELSENNVSFIYDNWQNTREKLEYLYQRKKELLLMHINSKELFGNVAHKLIYEKLCYHLKTRTIKKESFIDEELKNA
jgi:spore coat polysaccharide biosynthesis predicted glycosyltransferase SpsG